MLLMQRRYVAHATRGQQPAGVGCRQHQTRLCICSEPSLHPPMDVVASSGWDTALCSSSSLLPRTDALQADKVTSIPIYRL